MLSADMLLKLLEKASSLAKHLGLKAIGIIRGMVIGTVGDLAGKLSPLSKDRIMRLISIPHPAKSVKLPVTELKPANVGTVINQLTNQTLVEFSAVPDEQQ